MASDLQVPALASGMTIPIGPILKDNGDLEDLTTFDEIRLLIETFDHVTSTLNKVLGDAEISIDGTDSSILNWTPTNTNKTPAEGFYWLVVVRETTVGLLKHPARRQFLQCIKEVRTV